MLLEDLCSQITIQTDIAHAVVGLASHHDSTGPVRETGRPWRPRILARKLAVEDSSGAQSALRIVVCTVSVMLQSRRSGLSPSSAGPGQASEARVPLCIDGFVLVPSRSEGPEVV